MTAFDVLVVGAGPAGATAATLLARGGARVRMIDRSTFPRDKLCGDTINPGTLAILRRLNLANGIEARGLPITGMRITGPRGEVIDGAYPDGLWGIAIERRALDWALVQDAIRSGVDFEDGVTVRGALTGGRGSAITLEGVSLSSGGSSGTLHAPLVVAADGRRSLAFGLGLSRHPVKPRRWAVGAHFELASPGSSIGEMHIRTGRYIGVAPLPGGLANVCLVRPSSGGDAELGDPSAAIARAIADEPLLAGRFGGKAPIKSPTVLGPLAVDVGSRSIDGLILAGDAAGFVDPMTGDGLRFAVRGGELAADAALQALARGWSGVHAELAAARAREFGPKWRFNRTLRALVGSPAAIHAAAAGARLAPAAVRALVRRAGDCALARPR